MPLTRRHFTVLAAATATLSGFGRAMANSNEIKNIVFVHGAWGDGSHWRKVIPHFVKAGLNVTSVQMSLRSLASDVKEVQTVLDGLTGPTLLVGHSYGGCVISAAGNHPTVAGLVYLSAYAPEKGESAAALTARGGPIPEGFFVPNSAGFLLLNRDAFQTAFCQDLDNDDAVAMNAAQKPTHPDCLQSALDEEPAWKKKKARYGLTTEDHTVVPALQKFMAERAAPGRIHEIAGSHASMASRPNEVIALVEKALTDA